MAQSLLRRSWRGYSGQGIGVIRHADAGYERAKRVMEEEGIRGL
jgi:urocanate hydratase